jgi:hypothetical protein
LDEVAGLVLAHHQNPLVSVEHPEFGVWKIDDREVASIDGRDRP